MMRFLSLFFWVLVLLPACKSPQQLTLLAINDTYEISPLANGKEGGMARVATLYKELKSQNPHTYMLHAGDFLNPSVIGTLRYEGKRIQGRQMVEVMNAMGIDYVTFGNHEFDLSEEDLQARLNESDFTWVVANITHLRNDGTEQPFTRYRNGEALPSPTSVILEVPGARVGLLGVCIETDKPFARFDRVLDAAQSEYEKLSTRCDFVVALTHLTVEQDMELARQLPGLKLIIGGHDHENMRHVVGNTVICKADANAKSTYIHQLRYKPGTKKVKVRSTLKYIDDSIADDPQTAEVVSKWEQIASQSFAELGFDPKERIFTTTSALDGLESSVRNKSTNLTEIIARAITAACPQTDATFYNGGSIRIDDKLSGNITQYDIIRILPFGGALVEVEMKGSLLKKVLDAGLHNKGIGGFLHHDRISYKADTQSWLVAGKPLDEATIYRIATTDFLLTGREQNMDFLSEQNPEVLKVTRFEAPDTRADIRKALISYLQSLPSGR